MVAILSRPQCVDKVFIEENAFKNVCKMSAILSES